MPPIRAVLPLLDVSSQPDGAQIVCQNKAAITLNTASLSVAQRTSAATMEAAYNAALIVSLAGEFQAVVHVVTLTPLVLTVCCADNGVVIPEKWWEAN